MTPRMLLASAVLAALLWPSSCYGCAEVNPAATAAAAAYKCIDEKVGCVDLATDTLTISLANVLPASGTLTAIRYFAMRPGAGSFQIWQQTGGEDFKAEYVIPFEAKGTGLQLLHLPPPGLVLTGKLKHVLGIWTPAGGVVAIRWANCVQQEDSSCKDGLQVARQARGVMASPAVGDGLSISAAGAPRSYAVTLTVCGDWGWSFVAVVLSGAAIYVGVGVAWGRRKTGTVGSGAGSNNAGSGGLAAMLQLRMHAHWPHFVEVGSLVEDGLCFTKSRFGVNGKGGRGGDNCGDHSSASATSKLVTASSKKSKKKVKSSSKRKDKAAATLRPQADAVEPVKNDNKASVKSEGSAVHEWTPTRSVLQQGARETGVKVGAHVPGQGLLR